MLQYPHPPHFDFQLAGREVVAIERDALTHLEQAINDDFDHACSTIFSGRGKVVMMGIGKSGHVAKKIAATFASTGTPAFFVHPGEANHGDLGMISADDIVIAISNSGEANEILSLIPVLKRIGVPLICMTGQPASTMAEAADIHLCINVVREACPLGLAPTASTTAALVMGDALAIATLRARGFTAEDFALSHPGGALGRKLLLRVGDIMHTGAAVPTVSLNTPLRDVLLEITLKRLGMTAVVDASMRVKGIFTDGDLRRIFDMQVDFQTVTADQIMTPGGVRIAPTLLAVEALNLMQRKNITSLLVTEDDQLIGVVHMHDMLRAGVL